MRSFLFVILLLFCSVNLISAQDTGEEKIKEIKSSIKNKSDSSDKKEKVKSSSSDVHVEDSIGWALTKAIFHLFFEVMSYVRYSDYPYSEEGNFHYADFVDYEAEYKEKRDFDRILNLNINMDTAYLDDTTFALNNRFMFNISAVHINLNQQSIWSGSEYLNSLSMNIGLNLSIKNFQMAAFLGGYELNWPGYHQWFTSFGFSSMLFLPGNTWLDYYGHYAIDNGTVINMQSLSVNYSFSRFTMGLGYVFYGYQLFDVSNHDYNSFLFHGPLIRLSLWI